MYGEAAVHQTKATEAAIAFKRYLVFFQSCHHLNDFKKSFVIIGTARVESAVENEGANT
jgi:hypothetical protein